MEGVYVCVRECVCPYSTCTVNKQYSGFVPMPPSKVIDFTSCTYATKVVAKRLHHTHTHTLPT